MTRNRVGIVPISLFWLILLNCLACKQPKQATEDADMDTQWIDSSQHVYQYGICIDSLDIEEYMIKSREDALKDNSSWLSWITAWLRTGIDSLHGFEDTVRAVTPQDVAAFLHDVLEQGNKIEITMTSPGKEQDRKTN